MERCWAAFGTRPDLLVATESWRPNVAVARNTLRALGGHLVAVADRPALPFAAASFDLVVSRHPVVTLWDEIARVLRPGGTYLSQQIGPGTNRELSEFFLGPTPVPEHRRPERAAEAAQAAGLDVVRLEPCALRVEFFDVAAVVYFLRKVIWTVPGFTPEAFDVELRHIHAHIAQHGSFVSTAQRFLIEAHRPARSWACPSDSSAPSSERLDGVWHLVTVASALAGRRRFSWPGSPCSCCSRGCAAVASPSG